jgi:acetylornithine deacetylase/succinyl-diaminopimelate desuccinylase-like protein
MKAGLVAALEAMRAVRDASCLPGGSILFTAHDLHEAPWGDGRQLNAMIGAGIVGDSVLLPEPLCDRLPVVGRGAATWKATVRRPGPPVHEVMRPLDEPNPIAVAALLITKFMDLDLSLSTDTHKVAGRSSLFVGQVHGGEIYNGFPQSCWLEGTRRWLPGTRCDEAELGLRQLVDDVASSSGARIDFEFALVRDSFALNESSALVAAFQQSHSAISGSPLPTGAKPFVDDGNSFFSAAGIPAITHGPKAGGQHTVDEWVDIDDLVRVARLYALTAIAYCPEVS